MTQGCMHVSTFPSLSQKWSRLGNITDAFHCEIGHILVESSLAKNIPTQKCIDVGTVLFLVLFCVLEIQFGLELTL